MCELDFENSLFFFIAHTINVSIVVINVSNSNKCLNVLNCSVLCSTIDIVDV